MARFSYRKSLATAQRARRAAEFTLDMSECSFRWREQHQSLTLIESTRLAATMA
jgi:hypothetical protein